MKISGKTLALATVALSLPLFAGAQNTQNSQASDTPQATATAARMVPVYAALSRTLDARKDHPGSSVEAKLTRKARLSDGTELPPGSILMGRVVEDDMQQHGRSKLALRFDQARLKDGKVIPLQATIVGIFGPVYGAADEGYDTANNWTNATVQVDQLNVVPGVDLHSNIASQDSGVFVSTKKDDVKLPQGSEVQFAIAPQASQANAGL
jgi:hypothetical protein